MCVCMYQLFHAQYTMLYLINLITVEAIFCFIQVALAFGYHAILILIRKMTFMF